MSKDQVFKEEIIKPTDFKFGSEVASVFDDMVNRSVPFYGEIQRMIAEQSASYATPGSNVYDLGCATGATLIGLNSVLADDIGFVGIDDSQEMLDKCRAKLEAASIKRPYELQIADLDQAFEMGSASLAILCLTLQFVRPINRTKLLTTICDGLQEGGALILVEKILAEDSDISREFIEHYYNYKRRNHYSEMEISQKREALENVLIPYKLSENIAMLHEAGFAHCEVFFKWYNFVGMLAVKKT